MEISLNICRTTFVRDDLVEVGHRLLLLLAQDVEGRPEQLRSVPDELVGFVSVGQSVDG